MTEDPLPRPIHIGGVNKTFGEVTLVDARDQAAQFKSVSGWGMSRVLPVARAWQDLVRTMESGQVERVDQLDKETIEAMARKLWILPPKGDSLI
ncbi:MAG: hypothetical protein QOD61_2447 [Solirubrobacteraceae bacterium]|jgi:hypothetical protein|nr:hypothetical protein [Solirubrobacteraceae bacterium]MEA2356318.1 hypothetical protein [Solirubrobacteraceae bacterium]